MCDKVGKLECGGVLGRIEKGGSKRNYMLKLIYNLFFGSQFAQRLIVRNMYMFNV
jgi:hypothetical protein